MPQRVKRSQTHLQQTHCVVFRNGLVFDDFCCGIGTALFCMWLLAYRSATKCPVLQLYFHLHDRCSGLCIDNDVPAGAPFKFAPSSLRRCSSMRMSTLRFITQSCTTHNRKGSVDAVQPTNSCAGTQQMSKCTGLKRQICSMLVCRIALDNWLKDTRTCPLPAQHPHPRHLHTTTRLRS